MYPNGPTPTTYSSLYCAFTLTGLRVHALYDPYSPFFKAVKKVTTAKENSIILAMKVVYWLAEESLLITKYDKVLNLLSICECPHVEGLKTSKSVNYSSDKAATEMLESIVVRKRLYN